MDLHVPMIKALFHQVANPNKLRPLDLVESLDWIAAALNRVDRAAFFEKFIESHAVQYFYVPFLEAFNPACWSLIASRTPRRPRSFRPTRKSRQVLALSRPASSIPSIRRRPSQLIPMANNNARLWITLASRTCS